MPEAWTERDSLAFVDGDRNGCSQEALAASEAECGVLGDYKQQLGELLEHLVVRAPWVVVGRGRADGKRGAGW